ncbi:hypothetical protein HK101_009590 [Irineochytrium annulatum]|nr:hypothetical protein HK101_009590 [Irineochytrium annulatum]
MSREGSHELARTGFAGVVVIGAAGGRPAAAATASSLGGGVPSSILSSGTVIKTKGRRERGSSPRVRLAAVSAHPTLWRSSSSSSTSPASPRLSHVDLAGKADMVNVSQKPDSHRVARAKGSVLFSSPDAFLLLESNAIAKGDVLTVARIAGIHAAKQAGYNIPLAHPLALTKVQVDFDLDAKGMAVEIMASAECVGKTGVEVEAMAAVSGAALTVFDMCKAVDKAIRITDIRVVFKSGGKSGTFVGK